MMWIRGRRRLLRVFVVLAACLAASGLAGCESDPSAIPAVSASGTVTYKGKPIAKGEIQFFPEVGGFSGQSSASRNASICSGLNRRPRFIP